MKQYILLYQLLTLLLLFMVSFFPRQLDAKIPYAIFSLAILLLPIFFKNAREDIAAKITTTLFFTLFLIASLLSTIFSIDYSHSIPQFLLYFSYFVIFTSIRSLFPTHKSKELFTTPFTGQALLICYLLFAILLSVISLYHTVILHYINRESEGISFMWIYYGHNHLAALLIFAIPFSLYLLKKYWNLISLRILLMGIFCFMLIALFFTFGFTSILSLWLSALIALLFFAPFTRLQKLAGSFILVVALEVFLLGTFVLPEKIGFEKRPLRSAATRLIYWQNALDNFSNNPITGSGLDTFRIVNKTSKYKPPLGSFYTHNFFLQMLSDAGILGFLSSILLIGSILWQSIKKIKGQRLMTNGQRRLGTMLFVGLLASTLNSLVDFDWQLPTVFLFFWIMAALQIPPHKGVQKLR